MTMAEEERKNEAPKQEAKMAPAKKQEAPKQEAKTAPAKTKKMDTIAQGKSRTSKRGILTHGDEVSPACFNGGKETFDRLKKQGVIVSVEVPAK